jgi:ethanolamine utilization protein EutA (predicted chaperonin)
MGRLAYQMILPIKNIIVEKIREEGNITDIELLSELQKKHNWINMNDLNQNLLELEIKGLIEVFQTTKDKRRIELIDVEIDT